MANADKPSLEIILMLCTLLMAAARGSCCGGESPRGALPDLRTPGLRGLGAADGLLRVPLASCARVLNRCDQGPACEKLALAEQLLTCMASDEKCDGRGYQWQPGTDDLSLPAGRAKWSIELLLGVKLPGAVDRSASPGYLKELRDAAHLAVEAYRQGIMALAADHEVSPDEFARLKRKYSGKVLRGPWAHGLPEIEMDALLLEWPPVGRKYEDLVSIIGTKGREGRVGVSYTFSSAGSELNYTFVVRGGVIHTVRKTMR